MRRPLLILVFLSFSLPLFAQVSSSEFGRAVGGEVSLIVKRSNQLSGSFSFTRGKNSNALLGSVGGTVMPDHLWFFASAQRNEHPLTTMYGTPAVAPVINLKATAQAGSATTLTSSFVTDKAKTLDLTGVISPSAFFSLRASQTKQ